MPYCTFFAIRMCSSAEYCMQVVLYKVSQSVPSHVSANSPSLVLRNTGNGPLSGCAETNVVFSVRLEAQSQSVPDLFSPGVQNGRYVIKSVKVIKCL